MMDIHTACEEAYKRGYERGRAETLDEILPKLKRAIELGEHSADLINRKNAEIERLKEFIETTRLCDKELKAEAIKEFVKRVKRKKRITTVGFGMTDYVVDECVIDQIAKEMGVEL